MKKCFLTYWENVNAKENGYCLIGYYSEKEYFSGTKEECKEYAKNNNIKMEAEA